MASGANRIYHGIAIADGAEQDIQAPGFKPRYVRIMNPVRGTSIEWIKGMEEASAFAGGVKSPATQSGTGTLVAGTFTVANTIVLSATSKILLSLLDVATTTNYAGLAVSSRTAGALATAEFTVEAILATGAIDSDAAGDVDWVIVDEPAVGISAANGIVPISDGFTLGAEASLNVDGETLFYICTD